MIKKHIKHSKISDFLSKSKNANKPCVEQKIKCNHKYYPVIVCFKDESSGFLQFYCKFCKISILFTLRLFVNIKFAIYSHNSGIRKDSLFPNLYL